MAKKTTRPKTTARKSNANKKSPSAKKKASATKRPERRLAEEASTTHPGDAEVTIDRRRGSRRAEDLADALSTETAGESAPLERRQKVNRRRQIDPTTCERDYSDQEVEFMNALDAYKRKSGRMFPTCSEVLEVIRDLGYVQLAPSEAAQHTFEQTEPAQELDP